MVTPLKKSIIGSLLSLSMLLTSCGGSSEQVMPQQPQTMGNPTAKVVLVEFSDFQCPACAAAEPFVKKVVAKYKDTIKFEYRYFPLRSIHKHAELSAYVAEAAGRQGKFWEMHDKLFSEQPNWSDKDNAKELFMKYAKELNLDVAKLEKDMEDASVKAAVERDVAYGNSLTVNSTPSFYINGNKLKPKSFEEFEKMVDEAIKGSQQ